MKWLKKRWWLIPVVIFVLIVVNANFLIDKLGIFDEIDKQTIEYFVNDSYKGVIIQKNDKPGKSTDRTALIIVNGKRVGVDLRAETAIFDYVRVGDSIVKQSGNLAVDIYRGGVKDTTMMIYFD